MLPLAIMVLGGCANTVPVELSFPSESAALVGRNADIIVVRAEPGNLNTCPPLFATGATDTLFEASVPICELRSYPLPDPGGGLVAIAVLVRDSLNAVILQGCVVAEVYPGRGPLVVDLYPTASYTAAAIRDAPPPGTTLSTLCGGGR